MTLKEILNAHDSIDKSAVLFLSYIFIIYNFCENAPAQLTIPTDKHTVKLFSMDDSINYPIYFLIISTKNEIQLHMSIILSCLLLAILDDSQQ